MLLIGLALADVKLQWLSTWPALTASTGPTKRHQAAAAIRRGEYRRP